MFGNLKTKQTHYRIWETMTTVLIVDLRRLGVTLLSPTTSTPIKLLPGVYTSTTNPQLLHNALTSSASITTSAGFGNSSSLSLPLNLALQPGVSIYSGPLYSGQAAFTALPSSPIVGASTPITARALGLATNIWIALSAGDSNNRFIVWDPVPDVNQLPSGSQGTLALTDIQSTACTPGCSSSGICTASGSCQCAPGFGGTSCEACVPGFFGPKCQACPNNCDTCDDGITGTGRCIKPTLTNDPAKCNCKNGVMMVLLAPSACLDFSRLQTVIAKPASLGVLNALMEQEHAPSVFPTLAETETIPQNVHHLPKSTAIIKSVRTVALGTVLNVLDALLHVSHALDQPPTIVWFLAIRPVAPVQDHRHSAFLALTINWPQRANAFKVVHRTPFLLLEDRSTNAQVAPQIDPYLQTGDVYPRAASRNISTLSHPPARHAIRAARVAPVEAPAIASLARARPKSSVRDRAKLLTARAIPTSFQVSTRPSTAPPLPTVTGIDTPTTVVKSGRLEWWQILLMALGCAFIFLVILWLFRRRQRKKRAQKTAIFTAGHVSRGPTGWRWRLIRWGEKLFGHRRSRKAPGAAGPTIVHLGPLEYQPETEQSMLLKMRAAEEARTAYEPITYTPRPPQRPPRPASQEVDMIDLIGSYNATNEPRQTTYFFKQNNKSLGHLNGPQRDPRQSISDDSSSQFSEPSIYSQMTGAPRRMPEPRQPVKERNTTSRWSAASFDLTELKKKSRNPFWK
uniref:EGF-like domain-containing protein n=1 Tax=Psilocybe cubensis TaxID=181762 RepID=A0A8H7XRI1_PSICU